MPAMISGDCSLPAGNGESVLPGDSSRDLFIPDRWRSPTAFPKGHVSSPSQKGQQNCQENCDFNLSSLPETNSSHLKMDAWNTVRTMDIPMSWQFCW